MNRWQKEFVQLTNSQAQLKSFMKNARLKAGILKKSTVLKLNLVFRGGYCADRAYEEYGGYITFGYPSNCLINCLAHSCFNLTDKIMKQYRFAGNEMDSFKFFPNINFRDPEKDSRVLFDFVESTGLIVENSSLDEVIDQPNQWKVALYFSDEIKDFHFLKEEKDGRWTSKWGSLKEIEVFDEPQEILHDSYGLFAFKKITNPYFSKSADEKDICL